MAKEHKREELYATTNSKTTIARLHEDIYNKEKQGEVNKYKSIIKGIKTREAREATIRARVKWQKVGDKCFGNFLESLKQRNAQAVIAELRDNQGRSFIKKEDLEVIYPNFYKNLYKHKKFQRRP